MIIKRIYFPNATYQQNEKEFLKMLSTFEISWYKPASQMHVNDKQVKLLSGIYISKDQNKKIFAFFEGNGKPATMIVKISSGGGNFLIDLNSFCNSTGCTIEDKDEKYLNSILMRLKEFKDINLPDECGENRGYRDRSDGNKKLTDFKIGTFDIKLRRMTRSRLKRHVITYGNSLLSRGVSIKVASYFKKRFIKEDVRWALENGWIA